MLSARRFYRFIVFSLVLLAVLPLGLSASRPSNVDAQVSGPIWIESDDSSVQQVGIWTSQTASSASGGRYLYSSGSPDDVLVLDFYGSSIEIVYVGNPSFGTFAIEIDNDIRRTVVSTNQETTFDNRAVVDYLDAGPHSLRVYAVDGVIAIDAFITRLTPPPPSSAPTENTEAGVTWYVIKLTGNDNNSCLSTEAACKTIQAAINKASADDIISIGSGNYVETLTVNKNLTFVGKLNGETKQTYISGVGLSTSVVTINTGITAEFKDLAIVQGEAGTLTTVNFNQAYAGGGIYNQGNLTLTNARVALNSLDFGPIVVAGVGIFNRDGALLTLNNSTIEENVAHNVATDDYRVAVGAGIFNEANATLIVKNSLIDDNRIVNETTHLFNGQGGGIFSDGNLTIIDSTISNNEIVGDVGGIVTGGGLLINDNPGGISITRTSFLNNRATSPTQGDGAGIWINGSVDHRDVSIVDSYFNNNESSSCCAAIFNLNQTLTIINTTFTENVAANVAAIGNGGILNIANSTVSANTTTGIGGAIYGEQGVGGVINTINITNSTIVNNIADSDNNGSGTGAGVYNVLGTVTVKNSIISNNTRGDGTEDDCSGAGTVTSGGYNLVGQNGDAGGCTTTASDIVLSGDIDSIIERLFNNGGYAYMHALWKNTIAIDAIPPASCTYLSSGTNPLFNNDDPVTIDQRGSTRPANTNCDIGAYEDDGLVCTLDDSIIRINVGPNGEQATPESGVQISGLDMSSDGRFVTFSAGSDNLVPNDVNGVSDTFRYDRITGELIIINRPDGQPITQGTGNPSISSDGQHIALDSLDGNIVAGDTNNRTDIFVFDLQANTVERISVSSGGIQGDETSLFSDMSSDGQIVAYNSYATNLVVGDTNDSPDLFLRDLQTDLTSRESVSSTGEQADENDFNLGASWPSISADNRYIAFTSSASNLVLNDTNLLEDIFVRDRQLNQTFRVSVSSTGVESNGMSFFPVISADGRYVAFVSEASNLVPNDTNGTWDVFVHDRQTGTTTRVSVSSTGEQGNSESHIYYAIDISSNGRFIAFPSFATNLVPNDTNNEMDLFIHDLQTGQTTRVTDSLRSEQPNGYTYFPKISADGSYIAFTSSASNLVCYDTNDVHDVFLAQVSFPAFVPTPTNLQATPVATTQIDLAWDDNASDETNYIIDRSNDGVNWTENYVTLPSDTTTYSDTGLTCNTTYYYRVRAYRSGDSTYSTYSNTAQATTDVCSLPTPTNLNTTPNGTNHIDLAWTDNSSDETAFHIERSLNGTNWFEINTVASNTTTYQDTVSCYITYHYRVRAFRSGDNTFSSYSNVTTGVSDCVFEYPVPLSPIGTITVPISTFQWGAAANATWYRLYVQTPAGVVFDQWFEVNGADLGCSDGICTLNSTNDFTNNNYMWYVDGWSPSGYTPWSSATNFTLNVPAPVVVNKTSPTNGATLTNGEVTFTWDHDPNATWYQFYVAGVSTWYNASDICVGGTCSTQRSLNNASYSWYVQAYGPGGTGPWGTGFNFTVAVPTPAILTKVAPIGSISTSTPDFEWQHDINATWYQVWIGNIDSTIHTAWYQASAICNSGTCTIPAPNTYFGQYQWYVRGWGVGGYGDWGTETVFSYTIALNAPTGTVNGTNVTYQWDHAGSTTAWYQIWVGVNGGSTVFSQWIEATTICSGATCSFTKIITLPVGNYSWYLQPYGTYGYGPWSAGQTFSVSSP